MSKQLTVKIKKLLPDVKTPTYSREGDAGMDLYANSLNIDNSGNYLYMEYGTGIAVKIPDGFVGLVFPRSSISNTDLTLANSVGVIDSGYTGEIKCRFKLSQEMPQWLEDRELIDERDSITYNVGDKIAQLIIIPYPKINFVEVDELEKTERGDGGFGSTN